MGVSDDSRVVIIALVFCASLRHPDKKFRGRFPTCPGRQDLRRSGGPDALGREVLDLDINQQATEETVDVFSLFD